MRYVFSVAAAAMLAALPALAEDFADPAEIRHQRGTWTLIEENDLFGGTDRNYTNGLQASWLSAPNALPEHLMWISETSLAPGAVWRYGVTVGQSMFTPNDISTSEPLPDQRPYAGWSFAAVSLVADRGERLDTFELHAGVIGPASGAEWVQRNWHQQIGSPDPKGWDNQLHNEPGFMLVYERKYRSLAEFGILGLGADITPHAGFALGNVHTHAAAGLTLRFGEDLKDDFGPPRVRPALAGSGFFEPEDSFSWYTFAGVEGRAVARNIFLDGNTFQDSASVEKNIFVGDLQAGVVVQAHGVQLAFTGVLRSEEYKSQDAPDLFGAVSLGWKW